MIGFPKYDIAEAVHYIMSQLDNNGFKTKYIHPNLIIICWSHWVPSYVRKQLKKKTGIEVDSFGQEIVQEDEDEFKVSFLKNKNPKPNKSASSTSSNNYDSKFIEKTSFFKDKGSSGKQAKEFKTLTKPKKDFVSISKFNPNNNLVYDEQLLNNMKNNTD